MIAEGNQFQAQNSSPKKRVLFIVTQSEFGGAQRFLLNLIGHLDKSDYDIAVAAGTSKNGIIETLNEKNIKTFELDSLRREANFWRDLKTLGEVKKLIKEFQPDVLFLLSSKAGFIGSLAARQLDLPIKVIYRIGGWTFNDPWPSWQKLFYLLLEKISAGWKDVIILNNQKDFELAQKNNIKPRREILVVPNGLDIYRMDFFSKEDARQKLKTPFVKTIIGTIANFYPAKGLEYLIETASFFKNSPEIAFVIIGDGIGRPELEIKIKELGLENKVFLSGQLANAYKYLPAFDIFVLPSIKEGFPWALIEAMAAKLPVIATSVGAAPEIIESGKNGFIIPPRDPEAIASAIKTILESAKLASELGIQAHQTVLFKYGLDKMIKQIETIL